MQHKRQDSFKAHFLNCQLAQTFVRYESSAAWISRKCVGSTQENFQEHCCTFTTGLSESTSKITWDNPNTKIAILVNFETQTLVLLNSIKLTKETAGSLQTFGNSSALDCAAGRSNRPVFAEMRRVCRQIYLADLYYAIIGDLRAGAGPCNALETCAVKTEV